MVDKLIIANVEYTKIDTVEKMTVPDCFVIGSNTIGSGHGEAKFYIGSRKNSNILEFFGGEGFNIKCFIKKTDLLKYMQDVKDEYYNPEQNYKKKESLKDLWKQRFEKIEELKDIENFNIIDQKQIKGERFYISSDKKANGRIRYIGYQILREISLPNITYLAVIKLRSPNNEIVYYFRLFVDYFDEIRNKKITEKEIKTIEKSNVTIEQKHQLIKARIGQGKYRQDLLALCPFCPITTVSDDRLLIASHIKPWAKSLENEKIDPLNGFMFTPNIDLLFDRGFISFTDDKKMLVSPWLSKMTCLKLNIVPNKTYKLLPIEGREKYLAYHRENIYKS